MTGAPSFFPSRTLGWYVARMFLIRSLVILLLLVLVLQTLDLLGESGKILAVPGNGDAQVWYYASLRFPQIVARFMPFSLLLGTLVTLVTLNQNSEIITMKAGGMSAHQILAPLFVASLFVAGVGDVDGDAGHADDLAVGGAQRGEAGLEGAAGLVGDGRDLHGLAAALLPGPRIEHDEHVLRLLAGARDATHDDGASW